MVELVGLLLAGLNLARKDTVAVEAPRNTWLENRNQESKMMQ
jgi:hypothetical protein